jgi:beta-glucanase (GH16 family)
MGTPLEVRVMTIAPFRSLARAALVCVLAPLAAGCGGAGPSSGNGGAPNDSDTGVDGGSSTDSGSSGRRAPAKDAGTTAADKGDAGGKETATSGTSPDAGGADQAAAVDSGGQTTGAGCPARAGYAVTLDEEFDQKTVDPTRWVTYSGPPNLGPGEVGAYVPANVVSQEPASNGLLLMDKAETFAATQTTSFNYTAGAIHGWGIPALYGYWEVRAKLPDIGSGNTGTWPAFWFMPMDGTWDWEIDVMEQFANDEYSASGDPSHVYGHLHWGNGASSAETCASVADSANWTGWHTFAVDWEPSGGGSSGADPFIAIYVDGVLCAGSDSQPDGTYTGAGVPNVPMYPILNAGVAGGAVNANFPAAYSIDHVCGYRRNDVPPSPAPTLTVSNLQTDKSTYHPGDTVTFSGTASAGASAIQTFYGSVGLWDFCGDNGSGNTTCSPTNAEFTSQGVGDITGFSIPANGGVPFKVTLPIPSNIPTGYTYQAEAYMGSTSPSVQVAAQYVPIVVE